MRLPPGADPEHENWKGIDLSPKPPVEPNSPAQQIHHLLPPEGYDLAPVLSEPAIRQPTEIQFEAPPVYRESEDGEELPPLGTAPRRYEVAVSLDGENWTHIASGEAEGEEIRIAFPPSRARYLRITRASAAGEGGPGSSVESGPWRMRELEIFVRKPGSDSSG